MTARGINMIMIATTVATTAIASTNFSREKTVLKSMVFGPTNTPAPRLPNRLLLKRALPGDVPCWIWKHNTHFLIMTLLVASATSANWLLLRCSSSVSASLYPKHNSGAGDTAKATGPIYLMFFHGEIILSR